MPDSSKKKSVASPSPGLMQRIFGSDKMTPEMEAGIKIAQSENPNLAPVQPYGMLSRMMQPNAMGYTSPGRTIYLNPRIMEGQSPQDVADTLIHEQEHVKQMQGRGYNPVREFIHEATSGNEPYHRRPDELAAFEAEIRRRGGAGRFQTAVPSFETGEMITPQDIRLFSPKKNTNLTAPTSGKLNQITKK